MEQQKRWCIFTSAGDHNAIRLWLQGNVPRRWDLIVAYYGDNDHEFAEINKISSNAFRAKGGKFQILKKLMVQNPRCLDQYSHVWVCDDDIRMSAAQINEAFAIAEFFKFWVAQPSFLQEGKIIPRKEQVTSANLHPGREFLSQKHQKESLLTWLRAFRAGWFLGTLPIVLGCSLGDRLHRSHPVTNSMSVVVDDAHHHQEHCA